MEAAADAAGRAAQGPGRVDGGRRAVAGGGTGLPVQSQGAQELRGLGPEVAREGFPVIGPI